MRFQSLTSHLTFYFLALSLFAMALVGYSAYALSRQALTHLIVERLNLTISLKESEIVRWIESQRNQVEHLATSNELSDMASVIETYRSVCTQFNQNSTTSGNCSSENIQHFESTYLRLSEMFERTLALQHDLSEIMLLSPQDGEVLFSTEFNRVGKVFNNSLFFQEGRKGTIVQGISHHEQQGPATMTIAAPVKATQADGTDQLVGVLAVNLNLARLDEIVGEQTGWGGRGITYLVDLDHHLLNPLRISQVKGIPIEQVQQVSSAGIDAALNGQNGFEIYRDFSNRSVMGAFRWLPNQNLALVAEIAADQVYAPARRLGFTIFFVGLLVSLVVAMWAFLLARRAAAPITAVTRAAVQLAEGDLRQPHYTVRQSSDQPIISPIDLKLAAQAGAEIGALAQTFNRMAVQLRQAYNELHSSEQYYRALIENNSDLILVLDRRGCIRYASPSLERCMGYKPQEIVGHLVTDYLHSDDINAARRLIQPFLKNDQRTGDESEGDTDRTSGDNNRLPLMHNQLRVRHADGGIRTFETQITNLLDDPAIQGLVVNARDITERKKVEAALQNYTQRLETLRKVDSAILSTQATSHSTYTQSIALSALEHIAPLLPCRRLAVVVFEAISPDTNAETTPSLVNKTISLPDGDRDLAFSSMPVSDNLARISQAYQEADTLSQRILLAADGLQAHPELAVQIGRLGKQGLSHFVHIPLIAQGEMIGLVNLALEDGQAFTDEHMETADELAEVLAVAIQQSRLYEAIANHSQELEARVQQRTSELETKNRELETFAYSVSHDLKAPLRGIDGYSRLLLDDYGDRMDDEGRYLLNMVREGAGRMYQLIDDLLLYSRLERRAVVTSEVDLPALVGQLIAERQSEIQARHVEVLTDIQCARVNAESEGLAQALRNLIDNALKFTPEHGARIEISAIPQDNSCLLWVRDNGIGFDMKYHDRVFEIFQRLHHAEDYPGTGIGLALVRKVMQRIGGRVWAEAVPNGGATFFLELPV